MRQKSLEQIWNQVPADYYQQGANRNLLQWIWHTWKIEFAKKQVRQVNFRRCLDIGCASGYMLSQIAKVNPQAKYFGVDVYKRAIDFAKEQYPNFNFQIAKADRLPFKDEFFDLIIFYETIEHVENPEVVLKEVKRVLRKGGTLILAMDSGSLLFRIVWFIWEKTKGKVWKDAHLFPFTHRQLEQLVNDSGFKIRNKSMTHLGMEVVFILSK